MSGPASSKEVRWWLGAVVSRALDVVMRTGKLGKCWNMRGVKATCNYRYMWFV